MPRINLYLLPLFLFLSPLISYAAEQPVKITEEARKEEALVFEGFGARFQQARNRLAEKYGTIFAFLFNSTEQLIVTSKQNDGKGRNVWYWNLEVDQKLWPGAILNMELEMDKNLGIDKYIPNFFMFNTNASLNTTPYIIRLYLEQKLFKDKFTVEAGKLDLNDWLDTSAVANSGDLQFFSDALVNNLSIPFPAKGAGALFNFRPYDWMYFATGAATADSVSTMVGLNNAFNSTFFISELGFSRTIAGRQGNYRLIFHLEHQKFVCFAGMDTDDETEKRNQAGYALSFDQALTDKLTLFARYGFANRKVRKIEHFISCGAQLDAFFTPLKYDYIGFGYALSLMSSDWRAYNGEDTASTESIYELYWNLWPNSFVSVTPDVQVALHPKADRSERVVVTCGMRVLVAF